ncbi:MAG TPA: P-loop NTPase fold protein [Conexibacter sp.]|nr:P-loop NTPase fold protein [Conexibacter sp.]
MFERFTERAREVVILAQDEAQTLGHEAIDLPHLEVGLAREDEGLGARVLREFGVDAQIARDALVRRIPSRSPHDDPIPFTESAKRALDLTLREASNLGHNYIGTEHILLAAMRAEERQGGGLLIDDCGLDPDQIRDAVIRLLSGPARRPRPKAPARRPQRKTPARRAAKAGAPATAPAATGPEPPDVQAPEALGLEAAPTHADRPALRDELGRARLAEVLAERIRRVRGEDTEVVVQGRRDRRRKLRRDRHEAKRAGSFMVHVHAPWGAGKSSLLNFLSTDLRNREAPAHGASVRRAFAWRRASHPSLSRWIVTDFSAWEHQRLDPPWWWLLAAIRRACVRELWRIDRGRWAWFLLRDIAWRLWNSRAVWLALALAGALALLATSLDWFGLQGRSLSALQSVAASVSVLLALGTTIWGRIRGTSRWLAIGSAEGAVKFLRRANDPLGVYRRRFSWLVRSAGHPVAVFVDDLDRCRAEYVVGLLEGIQTLFMGEPVTFVVAADRTWLCESFASVYGTFQQAVGEPGRPLGYLFLEKTFQVSMEIPPMTFEDRRRYWQALTTDVADPPRAEGEPADPRLAERLFAQARTHGEVEQRIGELLRAEHGEDRVLRAAVRRLNAPDLQAQLEDLLGPFAPLLENNPRSMKRLVNAYGIERDRLLREGRLPSEEERKQLVLFTILRLRWPRFAEHVLRRPEDIALCGDSERVPEGHPYGTLLCDRDVCAVFDGSLVDARLDVDSLRRYAGREPLQSPSVGA